MDTEFREPRRRYQSDPGPVSPHAHRSSRRLQAIRREAQALLDAGDAIIDQALSSDSLNFLNSTRQRGGQ